MTAGMLLGERVTEGDGTVVDLRDPRIAAGVIIAGPGDPTYLTGPARDRYPILRTLDFSAMFHGVDERVPTESLRFGTRVLDRLLRTC